MLRHIGQWLASAGSAVTGILSELSISKRLTNIHEIKETNYKKSSNGFPSLGDENAFAFEEEEDETNIIERVQSITFGISRQKVFNPVDYIVHPDAAHPLWSKLNQIGFPSMDGPERINSAESHMNIYGNFVAVHNMEMRIPKWTFEILTFASISLSRASKLHEPLKPFTDPTIINPENRLTKADFKIINERGQLSLGQMAARSNYKYCHSFYKMTMVLTNLAPMDKTLNQGLWQNVQEFQQELARSYPTVLVFTGPIVDYVNAKPTNKDSSMDTTDCTGTPKQLIEVKVIRPDVKLIVEPTSFFKVIVCQNNDQSMDFWFLEIPNISLGKEANVMDYTTDLQTISAKTGLKFLERLREDHEKGKIYFGGCNGKPCPRDIMDFNDSKPVKKPVVRYDDNRFIDIRRKNEKKVFGIHQGS